MQVQDRFGPSGRHPHATFYSFIQKYGRTYKIGTEEYESRRALFDKRSAEVEAHNAKPGRIWTAGVNSLSDWTEGELQQLRGLRTVAGGKRGEFGHGSKMSHGVSLRQAGRGSSLPEEVSWTNLTSSKTIHNQGSCGSCWAIATIHMLEATHEIHRGHRTFSAQELVNCVPNHHHCGGSGGCDGATVELALQYAMTHGLATESDEPYNGVDMSCNNKVSLMQGDGDDDLEELVTPGVHEAFSGAEGLKLGLVSWQRLPENKYEPLMRALVEDGPVAVSVAASKWASYVGGVFEACDKDAVIDHAVTLIGYGRDSELDKKFWLIQNSWGSDWGMDGRVKLLRRDSDETECGIDRQPEVGTGCDGGPKEVKVCGMCGILYDSVVAKFEK